MKMAICGLAMCIVVATGCDQTSVDRLKDGATYARVVGHWRVESFTAKPNKKDPLVALLAPAVVDLVDPHLRLNLSADGTFELSRGVFGQTIEVETGTWRAENGTIVFSNGLSRLKLRGDRLIDDHGPAVMVLARG